MAQLKTGIWVDALIRRAQLGGAYGCIIEQGDRDAGTVLVTVRSPAALTLYTPERDMDGARIWRSAELDEPALAAAIKSRLDFDSDLIVVEIEDPDGRHFIEEPVLTDPAIPAAGAEFEAAAKALFRDR